MGQGAVAGGRHRRRRGRFIAAGSHGFDVPSPPRPSGPADRGRGGLRIRCPAAAAWSRPPAAGGAIRRRSAPTSARLRDGRRSPARPARRRCAAGGSAPRPGRRGRVGFEPESPLAGRQLDRRADRFAASCRRVPYGEAGAPVGSERAVDAVADVPSSGRVADVAAAVAVAARTAWTTGRRTGDRLRRRRGGRGSRLFARVVVPGVGGVAPLAVGVATPATAAVAGPVGAGGDVWAGGCARGSGAGPWSVVSDPMSARPVRWGAATAVAATGSGTVTPVGTAAAAPAPDPRPGCPLSSWMRRPACLGAPDFCWPSAGAVRATSSFRTVANPSSRRARPRRR